MREHFTETGLQNIEGCSEKEHHEIAATLHRVERGYQWCLGDWFNNIPRKTHAEKVAYCEQEKIKYATASRAGQVAKTIPYSLRNERLSFNHYVVLCIEALSAQQRRDLVKKATESEGLKKDKDGNPIPWSSGQLRRERDRMLGVEVSPRRIESVDRDFEDFLASLPKSLSNKARKAFKAFYQKMLDSFNAEVAKQVHDEVKAERASLRSVRADIEEQRRITIKLQAGVSSFITEAQYKTIRSCLHPDKNPHPKAGEAFDLIEKMWEQTNRYRKAK